MPANCFPLPEVDLVLIREADGTNVKWNRELKRYFMDTTRVTEAVLKPKCLPPVLHTIAANNGRMGNLFSACLGGGSGGQRLGDSSQNVTSSQRRRNKSDDPAEREQRLAAAEARAQGQKSRGVQQGGGKLASKLESQTSIGPGRIPIVERDQPDPVADVRMIKKPVQSINRTYAFLPLVAW